MDNEVNKEVNKVEVVMDEVMDKQVEKEANKVVDEANAVDKKLNECSVLQDGDDDRRRGDYEVNFGHGDDGRQRS